MDDLSELHERVAEAARRGDVLVVGEPTAGGEGSGGSLPSHEDDEAWAGRTIDGDWLAELLVSGEVHQRGLAVRGARVLGGLNLAGVRLAGRLRLVDCQFGESTIVLRDGSTRTLILDGVACGGIDAQVVQVDGALLVRRARINGPVRLDDARVEATVLMHGSRLVAPGRTALGAVGLHVGGAVMLRDGFVAEGEVRLSRAVIGGNLIMRECRVDNPASRTGDPAAAGRDRRFEAAARSALRANGAEVGGSLALGPDFVANGDVQLQGVRIGRDLIGSYGRFDNPGSDALRLEGANIGGGLFLQEAHTRGEINLVNAQVGGDVRCGGARMEAPGRRAIYGSRASIGGNFFLDRGSIVDGQVWLRGVKVGGSLRFGSAEFRGVDGLALNADIAEVAGSIRLDHAFTASGTVSLAGATIGALIDCTGAQLDGTDEARATVGTGQGAIPAPEGQNDQPEEPATSPTEHRKPCALDLSNAQVGGNLTLCSPFRAMGAVRFTDAQIRGDVDGRGCHVSNPGYYALHGSGARIDGRIDLSEGFALEGEVRLRGATIGRDIRIRDGTLTCTTGPAVHLVRTTVTGDLAIGPSCLVNGSIAVDGTSVGGDVRLECLTVTAADGTAISGENARIDGGFRLGADIGGGVMLNGISVGGAFDCRGASFRAPPGVSALEADRAQFAGGLSFERVTARGPVLVRSSTVGGHASCAGGRFINEIGVALSFGSTRFFGIVGLNQGFVAEGFVGLSGATIGSDLWLSRATLTNPAGWALALRHTHITGRLHLGDGFSAHGVVYLAGAEIGGDLRADGGVITASGGNPAMVATGARVAGALEIHDGFRAHGLVVLRNVTVGELHDDAASWPDLLDLDGFRYSELSCPSDDRGWRARSDWLRRQSTPSARGYVQLAAVYRAAGDEHDARRILMERHNVLLDPPERWRPQLPSGLRAALQRTWRWVLRLAIGHGFAPARSLGIALALVTGLALWVDHARSADMLVPNEETAATSGQPVPRPSRCDDRYPCVQPVTYAVDTLIPIFELGQRSRWAPDQSHRGTTIVDDGRWLAAATWVMSATGWALTTLVAASFTQVVRRE